MILDRTHWRWAATTTALVLVASAAFLLARSKSPGGVTGGSAAGLGFGLAAAAVMGSEGLLALRKRLRAWRLGRTSSWMRGHIWLGLLAVPLVLFHSGFRAGGSISTALLVLFGAVTASGLFGLALQQALPRLMTEQVEMETIYEQIPHVIAQLRDEARGRVEKAANETLTRCFRDEVDPYLASGGERGERLADRGRAGALFEQLRALVPPEIHDTVGDLAHICEERRQLALQARLHHWMHGWLLVHVPLSWALLLLVAAHAVVTLSY